MKKIIAVVVVVTLLCNCSANKLRSEYKLFKRDNALNYPKEKLCIKFTNDTTAYFINNYESNKEFNQKFIFQSIKTDFLVIKSVDKKNKDFISLNEGDTIIIDKKKLHFFYNGNIKYLLSFK